MADIELVIKIPEDLKKMIFDDEVFDIAHSYRLAMCVKNGTLLPKGHGRLGDLDALEQEMINGIKAGNYEDGYDNYSHINDTDDCVECVRYADTIIEADKTRSEE